MAVRAKDTLVKIYTVTRSEQGFTLQELLARRLKISRRAAKNIIDQKSVWVNNRCVWMAQHKLGAGDMVKLPQAVTVTPRGKSPVARQPGTIKVIYQDEYYLIVDKPAGILTMGGSESVTSLLRQQLKDPNIEAVHRLDKGTSGCLLLAKSQQALEAAIGFFKIRRVSKTYQVIVSGRFERNISTLNQELDGERAVTNIQRKAVSDIASFLQVKIETGRTHQIRRHLAAIRHPVLGDRQYGFKTADDPRLMAVPRQMLHAGSLQLPHPMIEDQVLRAHVPMPSDFKRSLQMFGMGK